MNAYNHITSGENNYKLDIEITDGWTWNMPDHINTTVLYKNSVFKTGKNDNKPFKNITRPILNLQYRAEGFDVKDVLLYIDDSSKYFKSFLLKKYHEKWARENSLDTFIDELVESYIDFGGVLVKKRKGKRPEVVPWQRIAFVDQTDIMNGPICEKHYYSPEELRQESSKGWKNINEVILLSQPQKTQSLVNSKKTNTPSKYVEVYELHALLPKYYLNDEYGYYAEDSPKAELIRQLHICTFYTDEQGNKQGITLWKGPEKELPYKFLARDAIYGRALGLGGAEELFEPQVWANYGIIRVKELLDAASKVLYKTTDPAFANRNKTHSLESGEILVLEDGKDIGQIDNFPRSTQLFDNFIASWEQHARQMGAANESILGESAAAGTPFKLQELITAESHSLHEYRKGKLAAFVDEIYRDWIVPHLAKDITNGTKFLVELDADEMQQIVEALVVSETNKVLFDLIVKGEEIFPEVIEGHKQRVRDEFRKGGNKRFIEILKGELKDAQMSVEINIVGKQKDLVGKTDKLVNIMRFVFSTFNPQTGKFVVFDDPRIAKLFNQIIESSGLSPIDIYAPSPLVSDRIPVEAVKPLEKLAQRPELAEQISNR